jgi:hypothetical protein
MTPEEFAGILVALGGVIAALATLWNAVRGYHREVNAKMDALLALTASASFAEGVASQSKPSVLAEKSQADQP